VADYRSPAPTVPEIKRMSLEELFIELSRTDVTIARLKIKLDAKVGPPRPTLRAHEAYERAQSQIIAEISSRYISEPEVRKAFLFRLLAAVATDAKALTSVSQDDEVWPMLYQRLTASMARLDSL